MEPRRGHQAEGKKAIANLPTTSPDVKTDPGTPPVTDLAGQADPSASTPDQQNAYADGAKASTPRRRRSSQAREARVLRPVQAQVEAILAKQ